MIGAMIGDIIGSPYEFTSNNCKRTDFPLFCSYSSYTDDSVMTAAVAEALMKNYGNEAATEEGVVKSMRKYGKLFPYAGYGGNFGYWLIRNDPKPYNSWGNGSAMRVSAVGWLYDTLEDVEKYAEITARVTHNHPEGIKGAQATAAAIFLGRQGKSKQEICDYVEKKYGYPLSKMTCDEIRPTYMMDESCQGSVPQAFCAFREGNSFEEVARLAVSLGGDSDTIAAIACSMAQAIYPIPDECIDEALRRLDVRLTDVVSRFHDFLKAKESAKESAKAKEVAVDPRG